MSYLKQTKDRGYFAPMSAELIAKMHAASQTCDRDEIMVLWDGTPNRPWGMFLSTKTEQEHADEQRPLKAWSDLTYIQKQQFLEDLSLLTLEEVALAHKVHLETVESVLAGVQAGFIVRHAG